MAEDKKQPPVPEAHTTPEAPAPKTPGGPAVEEQATIPGMESGPAPSGKVIDLSDVRAAGADKAKAAEPDKVEPPASKADKQPDKPAPAVDTRAGQEKPKQARPPKADKAPPTDKGAKKAEQADKPRRGRPPKDQATPEKKGKAAPAKAPAEAAKAGDLLLVRPGDRIPLDGIVVAGESRIDTSAITGEPVPRSVRPGDSLISGCVNTGGQLTMVVEKPLSESMVSRILSSMENAAATKPKMDRFITRFARVYTPVVVAVAAITAIIPSLITGDWGYWVYTALSFLVMSCPCALVLSVPLAFFSGIGAGSKQGILFKSGLSLEAMAQIRAVVMDKTGTLTKGEFRAKLVSGDEEMLRLCASCEQQSSHPIAVSIVAAAKESGLSLSLPESLEEIPGRGIRATTVGGVSVTYRDESGANRELLDAAGVYLDIYRGVGSGVQFEPLI